MLDETLIKMEESDYRSHSAFGFHDILALKKSFNHLVAKQNEQVTKDYFIFGQAAHLAALEPTLFEQKVVSMPPIDRRTKAGKEEYEAFCQAHEGKIILSQVDYEKVLAMRDVLQKSSEYKGILSKVTHTESCVFGTFEELPLKGRIDAAGELSTDEYFFIEYKTTQDAFFDSFKYDIHRYNYDLQLAYYGFLLSQKIAYDIRLFIVAQEKEPPFDFSLIEIEKNDALKSSLSSLLYTAVNNFSLKSGYSKDIHTYQPFLRG